MQTSPNPAASLLRQLGLRARPVVIAAGSACWLLFLLGLYLAAFYGPRYASWIFVASVIGLGVWGLPNSSTVRCGRTELASGPR